MKAMVMTAITSLLDNPAPLTLQELPFPVPGADEVLIQVTACGVCHTELDEIEGRTPPPHLPVIPGHQVVGVIRQIGENVQSRTIGERVGVGWIYSACGVCEYCLRGDDNLCREFKATGRDQHGGYAEYMTVPAPSAFPIPDTITDTEAAPLLCAGAIGYRSLRLSRLQDGQRLGLTGFGASGHLVLKLVQYMYPDSGVFVFARSEGEQEFAQELGAIWAGDTRDVPPEPLHCIIDTTPAWTPVLEALGHLKAGGRLIVNAIRKEDADKKALLGLDYPAHLWMEKEIKSVANVSRRDISEFLKIAGEMAIKPEVQLYALNQANTAICELKNRKIRGAKVLTIIS